MNQLGVHDDNDDIMEASRDGHQEVEVMKAGCSRAVAARQADSCVAETVLSIPRMQRRSCNRVVI